MNGDPVPVVLEVLSELAPVATEWLPDVPSIRVDIAGGTEAIPGIHDRVLLQVHCTHHTALQAAGLAREARAIVHAVNGAVGDVVITKVATSPPTVGIADDRAPSARSATFPASIWVHPAR